MFQPNDPQIAEIGHRIWKNSVLETAERHAMYCIAEKIGESRTRAELRRWVSRLERDTRTLLKKHWRCVEKVAAELLARHELVGAYVEDLIAQTAVKD
jgi:hypothetical protein